MPQTNMETRKEYNRRYYLNSKCEHERKKSTCKECVGKCICPHNRQKSLCKECVGSGICCHITQKSQCKECKGVSICSHNRRKITCKECKGNSICTHNRVKISCKECNPQLYLISLQRNTIQRYMKNSNLETLKPSIAYLGCSTEYFKEYIGKKMTEGMNWDNIHYDHIKPISEFVLKNEEEFLKCCHYSNFQPLSGVDNKIKHNKWCEQDETFWRQNIEGKEYLPIYTPQQK